MASNMTLFNHTIQRAQGAHLAVAGYFTAPKDKGIQSSSTTPAPRTQEIVVARTTGIEMFQLVGTSFVSTLYTDVFASIRDMKKIRLPQTEQDMLLISSDSGKFVVLRHCPRRNIFEKVVEETYGKTGARRVIPGQHLAVDPDGRAAMISAIEKSKLVYSLAATQTTAFSYEDAENMDAYDVSTTTRTSDTKDTSTIIVKSPLEAHQSHTLIYSTCGVHVPEYSNPTFACLEASYEDNMEVALDENGSRVLAKSLVFYELDLGVNSVSRVMSHPVDPSATSIHTVPYNTLTNQPGGVLVCAEDSVYLHVYVGTDQLTTGVTTTTNNTDNQSISILRALFPRRFETEEGATIMIVNVAPCTTIRKKRGSFYMLLQTELGDIFHMNITTQTSVNQQGYTEITPTDITVSYHDTIPPSSVFVTAESSFIRDEVFYCATDYLFAITDAGAQHVFRLNPQPVLTAMSSYSVLTKQLEAMQEIDVENGENNADTDTDADAMPSASLELDYFQPTPLKNIEEVTSDTTYAQPIMSLLAQPSRQPYLANTSGDIIADSGELTILAGRGHRSSIRMLRPGIGVQQLFETPLPGNPSAIFTIKETSTASTDPSVNDTTPHSLLVLSFLDSTIVLRVGESIEETDDSGLNTNVQSLLVTTLLEDLAEASISGESACTIVQVHPNGARLLRHTTQGLLVSEWSCPHTIVSCSANSHQLLVATTTGMIFLLETRGGQLVDIAQEQLKDVSCVSIAPVPIGRRRAGFFVAADYTGIVRVIQMKPGMATSTGSTGSISLHVVAQKILASPATSLHILSHKLTASDSTSSTISSTSTRLTLYIGLTNGLLERVSMNSLTGHLADSYTRILGVSPIQLHAIILNNSPAIIALSSKSWLFYEYAGQLQENVLAYDPIACAAPFQSDFDPNGILTVSSSSLRLLSVPKLGDIFTQRISPPLHYTPKRGVWYVPSIKAVEKMKLQIAEIIKKKSTPSSPTPGIEFSPIRALAIIEADDATYPHSYHTEQMTKLRETLSQSMEEVNITGTGEHGTNSNEQDELSNETRDYYTGVIQATSGTWGSCIRLVSSESMETVVHLELQDNMIATSIAVFHNQQGESYLAVGIVKDLQQLPSRKFTSASIQIYSLVQNAILDEEVRDDEEENGEGDNNTLRFKPSFNAKLLHSTSVPELVTTITSLPLPDIATPTAPILLVGCGTVLKMFELGRRRLLLKIENRHFPSSIVQTQISSCGTRAYIGDATEGVFYVSVDATEGQRRLDTIAASPTSRFITSLVAVDYDTVAIGDRFGNISLQRLTRETAEMMATDPTGGYQETENGERIRKPPVHLLEIATYHVGDMVTSMIKTSLIPGVPSVLFYSTISGAIAALVPLLSQADASFFTHLEMFLRRDVASLVGRDHLSFRSSYAPVNSIIDGDLLSIFINAYTGNSSAELTKEQIIEIAEAVASKPRDVVKKIQDIKQRVM